MQLQVQNSPFNEQQIELLNRVLPTLTDMQQYWLSGYLTAVHGSSALATDVGIAQSVPGVASAKQELTILYGSQTGNCQALSEQLEAKLKNDGFQVHCSCMSEFKPNQLKKLSYLFVIISTHGEGDPPDTAMSFHEFLHSRRAPKLNDLQYSVLSLGDSSYDLFCETGKQFDQRLEELGAKRLTPRVDCDLDYDEQAAEWFTAIQQSLKDQLDTATPQPATITPLAVVESSYSRTNPFKAEILENINLNGRGSMKETRHLELLIEGSNFTFAPGDSLGIYPENDQSLVNAIMAKMNWDPELKIEVGKAGKVVSLFEALHSFYEITVLSKPLLEKLAPLNKSGQLRDLLENRERLKEYIDGRDLLDLITDYPEWDTSAEEFVKNLRKLPPRLYSIASSYQANPEEVHLTIGAVRYEAHGRERRGVCSVQCAERLQPGDVIPVYVHRNPNFRLPADPDLPIIMIGPGTGVAPFRAFLEERETIGAQGKSWLFFGDQHFVTDFLYQTDWQRWLKNGTLTRMDVAFSRDQAEKVYVQHRMLEHANELFMWVNEGAHLYVCGDEKRMAKDVHDTLLTIFQQEGDMSEAEASEYLASLQQQKRYQRDVY